MTEFVTTPIAELKVPLYESIEIGEDLGPQQLSVDDHCIKRYAYAVDDYHPWSLSGGSPFGGRVAQAGLLVAPLLRLWNTRYDPNADVGLHQKEEIWFESAVKIGEQVTLRGHVVDKYVKRGKEYVVTESAARATADDRVIVRHRATEVVAMKTSIELGAGTSTRDVDGATPVKRVRAEYPNGAAPAVAATPTLSVGTAIALPAKKVYQAQMSVYSNVEEFWRTAHTDVDTARRAGFRGTLAQALMGTMRISELGTSLFGASWFTSGWISVSYLKPIYANDRLEVKGVMVDQRSEAEGTRLEFEVWVENQEAEKVSVGWMSAVVV